MFPHTIQEYQNLIRETAYVKLQTKINLETIEEITTEIEEGNQKLEQHSAALEDLTRCVEQWVFDEVDTTIGWMDKAEKEFNKSQQLREEQERLSTILEQAKLRIHKLETKLSNLIQYKTVLNSLLPELTIDDKTTLEDSKQLFTMMIELERSCMPVLEFKERVSKIVVDLQDDFKKFQQSTNNISNPVLQENEILKNQIAVQEETTNRLREQTMQVLKITGTEVIFNHEVIKMMVEIEDIYVRTIPNPVPKCGYIEMLDALTSFFYKSMKKLSKFSPDVIASIERRMRVSEGNALKQAGEAADALRKIAKLEEAFRSRQVVLRQPRWRSKPPHEHHFLTIKKELNLNEMQEHYLRNCNPFYFDF